MRVWIEVSLRHPPDQSRPSALFRALLPYSTLLAPMNQPPGGVALQKGEVWRQGWV